MRACMCLLMHSRMELLLTPWTVVNKVPRPWNFPGKNTGVGCHFLLQRAFPTQGSNLHLLHLLPQQAEPLPLRHLGSLGGGEIGFKTLLVLAKSKWKKSRFVIIAYVVKKRHKRPLTLGTVVALPCCLLSVP